MSIVVQAQGVSKRYGGFAALEDINFTIQKGSIVA